MFRKTIDPEGGWRSSRPSHPRRYKAFTHLYCETIGGGRLEVLDCCAEVSIRYDRALVASARELVTRKLHFSWVRVVSSERRETTFCDTLNVVIEICGKEPHLGLYLTL